MPSSFADGVRARLAGLSDEERLVLHTAALFGRQFDWRRLPGATGLPADVIAGALEGGVASQLLTVDGDAFRFRHMLTREAVVADLLPPRRVAARLHLSPRTVEKHVENLLRITAAPSRTQLVAIAGPESDLPSQAATIDLMRHLVTFTLYAAS